VKFWVIPEGEGATFSATRLGQKVAFWGTGSDTHTQGLKKQWFPCRHPLPKIPVLFMLLRGRRRKLEGEALLCSE
jgi:hypothetical protein